MRVRKRMILPAILAAVLLLFACAAGEETPLKVKMPEKVKGYTTSQIRIQSPAAGKAVLRLVDMKKYVWRTMEADLSEGENSIPWNGLGENLERMFAGPYRIEVTLAGEDGQERTASAQFTINGTTPTLVYALPSSETLYLDGSERWFVEYYVSAPCYADMDVLRDGKKIWTKTDWITAEDGESLFWNGSIGRGKTLEPGDYTLFFRSRVNPDYSFTCPLHVEETRKDYPEVGVTGPVIPERGMTDGEIWEIMMKPSVVIEGKSIYTRYDLYQQPSRRSKVVGSLRCATQGLEVLEEDGDWVRVSAWTHTDGSRVTGYLRKDTLTVYMPGKHYGVLVDKRDQTMAVYEDGRKIATLPVSTGKVSGIYTYRETPAGAFLTNLRMGASFAQEGFRYEYPIRYDAGNIIHGVGFTRSGRMRDYSETLPMLGQKASHGCVRVGPFVTEDCKINIYWLWTHLPYHTRVIILDN